MFLCPKKYEFNKRQIKYLEPVILKDQVVIDSIKVARVCGWPTPYSCIDIQVFLELTNFYYWFIYGFLDIVCLLFNISGSNTAQTQEHKQQYAFDILKITITTASVLASSNTSMLFRVEADSLDFATGVTLSQQSKENNK